MSAIIVDGKSIAQKIEDKLRIRVGQLKMQEKEPHLAVVLVGDHKPSETYVKKKQEAAERIGIRFSLHRLGKEATEDEVVSLLKRIQYEERVSGVIVQLPLPEEFDTRRILQHVRLEHDVDVLSYAHLGALMTGKELWQPPTPAAVLEILQEHRIDVSGKHVVLVGRGGLVGKPLAVLFMRKPVTLTVCGRATANLADKVRQGDIVICGVGKAEMVTGEMVREGAVVIDAGVSFRDGKMYGDIEFNSVKEKAHLVTPTPGGVGPLTVAKLLENTVRAAELL